MTNQLPDRRSPNRAGLSWPRTRHSRRARATRGLSVEGLEARALLSTMFVDDDWAGITAGVDVGGGRIFGTDAFATIQSAITNAVAGDELHIAEGTYTGTVTISKQLAIVGAGSSTTTLDVAGLAASNAVTISASGVSLSGLTITGAGNSVRPQYGVGVAGRSGLALSDVTVVGMSKSGLNLNGVTDFTITGVAARDNGGAGFFLTDPKRGTLTDVQTSGNAWTGLGFSTAGRYYAIGVEEIVIAGASTFGEVDSDNGGVMFEESRWDSTTSAYDPTNPYPITFSMSEADGADVTFKQDQPLGYALAGPQDDDWSVRRRFYATAEQGLAAAAGSPTHYLASDRTLATVGAFGEARTFLVSPLEAMSIQAAVDAAAAGDTVQVAAGVYEENVAVARPIALEGIGHATLRPASGTALSLAGAGSATIVRGLRIDGGEVGVAIQDGAGGVILEGVAVVGLDVGVRVGAVDGVTITSSIIEGNGDGVEVGAGATSVGVRWNRIVGNTRSSVTNLASAAVDAVHNWWGSNAGPGASAVGNVESAPYIVLTLSNPGGMLVGGSADLTADLKHDSTGADVSALGSIPGDSKIAFASSLGSVSPEFAPLVDGVAASVFSAGSAPGGAVLSATLDGAVAQVSVQVTAPTLAIAGPASVDQGAPYTLTLTAGPEAGAVSRWRIDWGDGTPAQVVEGSPPTVTRVLSTTPGDYTIRAWAETSLGEYEAGNVVAVVVANVAPTVAIVDGPAVVGQGATASFRAEGSDPGGVTLYAWAARLGDVVVAEGVGESFAFAPTTPGEYTIGVTAIDAQGERAYAERRLSVANAAPTVAIVEGPTGVAQGATAAFRAEGSAPRGGAVYTWSAKRGDETVATGSGETFAFAPTTPGEYTVSVTIADAQGERAAAERRLIVGNVAPSLELAAIPARVDVGAAITLQASAADANPGAALAYQWVVLRNGVVVASGDGPSLGFTPDVIGVYEVFVQVSDGEGGTASRSASFEAVPLPVGPMPPVAERIAEGVIARAVVQTERQDQRIAELTARYEANPSPIIQRLIQRSVQTRARIQAVAVRRVAMIQRTFSILRGGRLG